MTGGRLTEGIRPSLLFVVEILTVGFK